MSFTLYGRGAQFINFNIIGMLKAKELRQKTKEDLNKILRDERIKLRDLNFKMAGSQIKNFNELGIVRRNIAVVLTVLRELSK